MLVQSMVTKKSVSRKNRLIYGVLLLLLVVCLVPSLTVCAENDEDDASTWDQIKSDVKSGAAKAKAKVKKKAPAIKQKAKAAAKTVKEKAPAAAEKVKDAGGKAAEKISDFRQGQEDQFWQRFEEQTGVETGLTGESDTADNSGASDTATADSTVDSSVTATSDASAVASENPENPSAAPSSTETTAGDVATSDPSASSVSKQDKPQPDKPAVMEEANRTAELEATLRSVIIIVIAFAIITAAGIAVALIYHKNKGDY